MACRCYDIELCEGDISKLQLAIEELNASLSMNDHWMSEQDSARRNETNAYELVDTARNEMKRRQYMRLDNMQSGIEALRRRISSELYQLENELSAMRREDSAYHAPPPTPSKK